MSLTSAAAEPAGFVPTLQPPPSDVWAWWRAARKGAFGTFFPFEPQQGLYRYRPRKSDRGEPAKIWWDEECREWLAMVGTEEIEHQGRIAEIWRFSHQNPISSQTYEHVMGGGAWPDEIEGPPKPADAAIGHNSGRPEEEIRDEIAAADAAFGQWLREIGAIADEEQDARAVGYAKRFAKICKRIEAAHKEAKAPILEQARAVDAAWITGEGSVKAFAEACERRVLAAVEPYRLERARLQSEAKAQAEREKAERARIEASAKAQAEREGRTFAPPPVPPRTSYAPKKATGLKTVKDAVIDDLPALAAQIATMPEPPPEFVDACARIAKRMLMAGAEVKGAHLKEEQRAK